MAFDVCITLASAAICWIQDIFLGHHTLIFVIQTVTVKHEASQVLLWLVTNSDLRVIFNHDNIMPVANLEEQRLVFAQAIQSINKLERVHMLVIWVSLNADQFTLDDRTKCDRMQESMDLK